MATQYLEGELEAVREAVRRYCLRDGIPEELFDAAFAVDGRVYTDIKAERRRQDAEWGGPEHDDAHGLADWADFRNKFEKRIDEATRIAPFHAAKWYEVTRNSLVKIAALAVAQIEALDRGFDAPA